LCSIIDGTQKKKVFFKDMIKPDYNKPQNIKLCGD